jgi:hypothetical protein
LFIRIVHKKRCKMEMCALFGHWKKSFVTNILLCTLNVLTFHNYLKTEVLAFMIISREHILLDLLHVPFIDAAWVSF